ncbi:MAG: sugar transferase [Bacteroidetes bacterium]|nr:MAG: sugar transferase [Bacteroidota bacterium]
MSMVIDQVSNPAQVSETKLAAQFPDEVVRMLKEKIDWEHSGDILALDTRTALTPDPVKVKSVGIISNRQRLNDIRYVNKFLESVNQSLPMGGYYLGCVEVAKDRKARFMAKYPSPLNKLLYSFDFLIKRVWPKLPVFRRSYFALTGGRNRVIAEMETYGRLYSCGFRLIEKVKTDGKLYFLVEKTGEPEYNTEATYGPFIALRRVGKHGKIMKVYKLRTMSPYSEYVQQLIYEWNGLGDGAKFKDDPRITTLGQFLRKYWLDELPMLYNFIRGDVKVFGVRPISKHYFSLYPEEFQEFRKKFKPGLIPPVYVEIPKCIEDTIDIERRYLQAYEKQPFLTDFRYTYKAFYNIFIKMVRSN